nr:hypothetical protein [Tanacetum cinerariifolium]
MSSPSGPTVLETITPIERARDFPMITPLHDDPYMLVRQAYTHIVAYIKFEPLEDLVKTKETQPLSLKATPLSPNYTLASLDYTFDTPHSNQDSDPMEAFKTRTASPSDRVTKAMNVSPLSFRKRYKSSYETPSSSASPASSLTLPTRKRYRGTSEPILDNKTERDESKAEGTDSECEESEDEGLSSESEETAPEHAADQHVMQGLRERVATLEKRMDHFER